jgi:glycine cleavage system H lipoate-binding protein
LVLRPCLSAGLPLSGFVVASNINIAGSAIIVNKYKYTEFDYFIKLADKIVIPELPTFSHFVNDIE